MYWNADAKNKSQDKLRPSVNTGSHPSAQNSSTEFSYNIKAITIPNNSKSQAHTFIIKKHKS